MQQLAENGMEVLAATLEKILLKREEEWFSKSNLGEAETLLIGNVKNQDISQPLVSQRRYYQPGGYQEIILQPKIIKDGQETRRETGYPTIANTRTSNTSRKTWTVGMSLSSKNFIA